MSITVKKIQLIPIGDKEEKDRIYKYLRDGIYNQHRILNTYMSQVGTLYYKYNKDFTNPKFKEEFNAIFRNKNTAIYDFEQAKGLGMAGSCGRRVNKDFSIALKNGLASGERALPFYKRDFPLLIQGRFLTFYIGEDSYQDEEGNEKTVNAYFIKFVNGIHFKCVLGSRGRKRPDLYLPRLLQSIVEDPENYRICGSTIQFSKDNKIILNLTVDINKTVEEYNPVKGRVMGLAMGYDICLVAALSDNDEMYTIGDYIKDSVIEKRKKIQEDTRRLQMSMREDSKGGHGRKRKLAKLEQHKKYEKNVIQDFNHRLSKSVVSFAKKHNVEIIVLEGVSKEELEKYPILLRNWSYYQLQTFIKYKAKVEGIDVRVIEDKHTDTDDKTQKGRKKKKVLDEIVRKTCCVCGCSLDRDDNIIPKQIEWCHELSFTCPECGKTIDYSYNKAKNMIS
ncbi:MAG: IS200/IS605 family accessory protein TnpB-related protein [Eubacterium sp.]|nr:IS200/IS605 family accessory protein TnpB-related protein [Eubacterium sp.]